MTSVKIVDGRLVPSKEPEKKNGKPRKYPYPAEQYDALLKIAKAAKIDIGTSKAQNTRAVNSVVNAVVNQFIEQQGQSKEK